MSNALLESVTSASIYCNHVSLLVGSLVMLVVMKNTGPIFMNMAQIGRSRSNFKLQGHNWHIENLQTVIAQSWFKLHLHRICLHDKKFWHERLLVKFKTAIWRRFALCGWFLVKYTPNCSSIVTISGELVPSVASVLGPNRRRWTVDCVVCCMFFSSRFCRLIVLIYGCCVKLNKRVTYLC